MQTRVYTDKINIDNNSTKEFWLKRANNIYNLQTAKMKYILKKNQEGYNDRGRKTMNRRY